MPYSLSIKNDRQRLPTKTYDELTQASGEAIRHAGQHTLHWVQDAEGIHAKTQEHMYTIFHWSAT